MTEEIINEYGYIDDELKEKLKQAENTVNECHKYLAELEDKIESLEQENRELKAYKDVNEDFKKAWDELNKKYTEVLKLAKENADSNEYCLQELEQKYEQLRSALEEIRTYLDTLSSIDSDFTNTETYLRIQDKINEVLNLS